MTPRTYRSPSVDLPKPCDLLGRVIALNVSRGSIRWRVRGYGSGQLRLENVATGKRSQTPWSDIVADFTSGHLILD